MNPIYSLPHLLVWGLFLVEVKEQRQLALLLDPHSDESQNILTLTYDDAVSVLYEQKQIVLHGNLI